MATNYAALTPEQKASLNEARRLKYQALAAEEKQKLLDARKEYANSLDSQRKEQISQQRRIRRSLKTCTLQNSDGTTTELADPAMRKWLAKIARTRDLHKTTFQGTTTEIQQWDTLFPWPRLQAKVLVTRMERKLVTLLGTCCQVCKATSSQVIPTQWRVVPKWDPLATLPLQIIPIKAALRVPSDYVLLCSSCAFELRLLAYAWIFSDHSPRNTVPFNAPKPGSFSGEKFAEWDGWWPQVYPPGQPLRHKIESRVIKSLSCSIRDSNGDKIESILRPVSFYQWVGDQPRGLAWTEIMQFVKEDSGKEESQNHSVS